MKQCNYSREALFQLNGIPPLGMSISLALQHLVAMIVGCVTPAIIIANALGLPQSERVLLIQVSLVMSAVTTLIELFPIGGKLGSGLPVMFGISFAYLPSMQAIASGGGGLSAVAGAMIVGGVVATLVGIFIKPIRRLFPPVITGTVVFTIGLSLYPTAIHYMAGGAGNTYESVVTERGLTEALVYGSWQNWAIAAFTLAVVLVLTNHGKGICKLASILLGILAGYAVALAAGMVDLSGIGEASWFSLPQVLPFGVTFEPSGCIALGLLFAINSIQAIGDLTATTVGGMDREPTDRELQGGIAAYGVSNILTALLGGLPTAADRRVFTACRYHSEIFRRTHHHPAMRAGRGHGGGVFHHRHDRHEAHRRGGYHRPQHHHRGTVRGAGRRHLAGGGGAGTIPGGRDHHLRQVAGGHRHAVGGVPESGAAARGQMTHKREPSRRTAPFYASASSSTTGQWSLPVISGQMSALLTRGISRWDTMK